jgi:hypothetical protein
MNHELVLVTLAQVSVTLAALSGVAGVFRPQYSDSSKSEGARILLRDVALISLVVGLLAIIPLIVDRDHSHNAWRWLSGIAILYWVIAFIQTVPKLRRMFSAPKAIGVVGPSSTVVGLLLFLLNVIAPGVLSPNRFAGGLLCLLVVAGSNFVLAVFDLKEKA